MLDSLITFLEDLENTTREHEGYNAALTQLKKAERFLLNTQIPFICNHSDFQGFKDSCNKYLKCLKNVLSQDHPVITDACEKDEEFSLLHSRLLDEHFVPLAPTDLENILSFSSFPHDKTLDFCEKMSNFLSYTKRDLSSISKLLSKLGINELAPDIGKAADDFSKNIETCQGLIREHAGYNGAIEQLEKARISLRDQNTLIYSQMFTEETKDLLENRKYYLNEIGKIIKKRWDTTSPHYDASGYYLYEDPMHKRISDECYYINQLYLANPKEMLKTIHKLRQKMISNDESIKVRRLQPDTPATISISDLFDRNSLGKQVDMIFTHQRTMYSGDFKGYIPYLAAYKDFKVACDERKVLLGEICKKVDGEFLTNIIRELDLVNDFSHCEETPDVVEKLEQLRNLIAKSNKEIEARGLNRSSLRAGESTTVLRLTPHRAPGNGEISTANINSGDNNIIFLKQERV